MDCPDCNHTMRIEVDDQARYIYLCPFCGCTVDAPDQSDQDTEPNEAYQ